MSATLGRARLEEPQGPPDRIVLQPPPAIAPHEGAGGVAMNAIPMLGSLGSIVLVASMAGEGGATAGRSYLAAGMFLLATVGFVVVQIDRQRKLRSRQVTGSRTDYLRYLGEVRPVVREAADQQRRRLSWHHPDPAALPALAAERSRVWERGPTDEHFLRVRYGARAQPLATELVPPEHARGDEADPSAASALHRLLAVHGLQSDLPACIDLRGVDRIEVCGAQQPARALVRALVCSAAAFHSPDHLVVAVLASETELVHWDWLKWLPHALSSRESDAVGPRRAVTSSLEQLVALLPVDVGDHSRSGAGERPVTPHVLLLTDGAALPPGHPVVPPDGRAGVTVLDLLPSRRDEPAAPGRLRLELTDVGPGGAGTRPLRAIRVQEDPIAANGDQCDPATAEAFARRLAPLHTGTATEEPGGGPGPGRPHVEDLLDLGDVRRFDPGAGWRPRSGRDRLRVPIGVGQGGGTVHLDLKESAQQGMGPHGLVVGATGSGKSELLRTLVLGLALTHSPEQLNLVLVDFKGGATFAGLSDLPHVSALITNLARELTLVDRMQDALSGEMVRRQELLRSAGNVASARDYEEARRTREDLAPLPSLFIVVDEFSELLSAKPEFIDLFVAIGRLGRSLGLHLLLASQRLEEGRLRGLESHLSYRIGLRTFSAAESRAVLGVPDAAELPSVPGLGYLRADPASLLLFKAGYVSGPPHRPTRVRRDDGGPAPGILPVTISRVPDPTRTGTARPRPDPTPPRAEPASLLDVAVGRMRGRGPAAHQVWLPPLDVPDTLDRLLADLVVDDRLGLVSPRWRGHGGLVVPLGTVDRPREQRRETLAADLRGSSGHVAVVGGPRSGKSTLLRTVVASVALTTTPLECQFYVLDLGGGSLASLTRLPHVAGVATRSEPDVVRRILAEVRGIVDRREAYFRDHGIDSVETYRSRRAEGRADDGYGDVFLVVDGWSTLRAEFDELEVAIQQLSARGLTFGLHVVTAASRWADFRAAMRDTFGTRLELRLGDAMDSEVDRRQARLVPAARPGRGLVQGGLHFLAALPRVDGDPDPGTLGDGVDHLVERVAGAWPGPRGPKLRLLPERIELAAVREQAQRAGVAGRTLLLGLDEKDLAPVALDVDREPHLLVLGDGGSGKSATLRCYLHEVMRTRTPGQAQLVVVDYRRSLLGEVPDEYLLDHLSSAQRATAVLRELADRLEGRTPGDQVTPEQLRDRSWWTGPEVFVVVDDHDLVTTRQDGPLAALQPLLGRARDIGLHVAVARRSGGASRAMHEPVLQSLRDLAMPGLLLAGNPDEGPLIGSLRPAPAVPGRGRLVTRDRGVETVQVGWVDPTL